MLVPGRDFSRLNADAVVNSAPKALFAPQVSLGRFHRNVPQQELDLLQFAAGGVAQAGTGAPTIVRRQFGNTSPAGVLLHDVPDHFFGDSLSPNRSLPSHAPEDPPVGDRRRLEPEIDSRFDPIRHRNRPDMRRLADQVCDDPMFLSLLKVVYLQSSNLAAAQAATKHQC